MKTYTPEQFKVIVDRFMIQVMPEPNTGCWFWMGFVDQKGYGGAYHGGRMRYAHRVSVELFRGPIPKGLEIDHLCRVTGCVNPSHLEAVTKYINMERGMNPAAINKRKTHCKRGHEFTESNTRRFTTKGGRQGRECKECKRKYDSIRHKTRPPRIRQRSLMC